jgi:UDP-3-O-[3-hydroxymyristoyl] glucosamine N-acyltransferase
VTLSELIAGLGGTLVQGSAAYTLAGVNSAALAGSADLVFAEDAASSSEALASSAGAVVVRAAAPEMRAQFPGKNVIEVEQPRLWFARAAKLLRASHRQGSIDPSAVLGGGVELGANVFIGPNAVVGNGASVGDGSRIEAGAVIGAGVRIGDDCLIYPRAVLYAGTTLGDRVTVHAGAVLGADGFGYVRDAHSGAYTQFPQQGTPVIEDDVEIGANSTIDRGAFAETRIRRGTKIDNLIHIGHNCDIGEDVILVALTGISGSCTVGKGAVIAGQVGMGDHAHVGPGVILGGQAGLLPGKTVTNDVLWGTPARPLPQVLREIALVGRMARRGAKTGKKTETAE